MQLVMNAVRPKVAILAKIASSVSGAMIPREHLALS